MNLYIVIGGKWKDQVNGNTYHNSKIYSVNDNCIFYSGFSYGYGSSYMDSAKRKISEIESGEFSIIDMGFFYVPKRKLEKCEF